MTISAIALHDDGLVFAGKHQDILIYRHATGAVEEVPTSGTWIGIIDDLGDYLEDSRVKVNEGDLILLYTDGVTEAANREGSMYGEDRLKDALGRYANLEVEDVVAGIIGDVQRHLDRQVDDMTLVAIRRASL